MHKNNKNIILIDVTPLFDQYYSRGIGRYLRDMCKELLKIIIEEGNWELHLTGFNDVKSNLIEIGLSQFSIEEILPQVQFHTLGKPKNSSLSNIFRWRSSYQKVIDFVEPDIFLSFNFERGLPSARFITRNHLNIKTAIVVHDFINGIDSKYLNGQSFLENYLRKLMWNGVRNANLVVSQSDFSSKDLEHAGKVQKSIIRKINPGINENFYKENNVMYPDQIAELRNRFSIDQDYFFFDSALDKRKGSIELVNLLVKLYKDYNDRKIPQKIVITGAGELTQGVGKKIKPKSAVAKEFLEYAKKNNIIDRIISTGKLDEDDLIAVLSNSKAYLYLSLYEGFAHGPLQALASKVPVIVNNSSSIPELVSDTALLIDIYNIDESAEKIIDFLKNDKHIKSNIDKGVEIAKKYDWYDSAKQLWSELKTLVPESVNEYNDVSARNLDFN